MRVLFFRATAPHPNVAPALLSQAGSVLRPFNRYLAQAIHTAHQRQVRYKLPWERVRHLSALTLTPRDTRLRIRRPRPAWRITNWPADRAPDPSQKLMVVNRGVTLDAREFERVGDALRILPEAELAPDDVVFWCGVQCVLRPEPTPPPPTSLATLAGTPLRITRPFTGDEHGGWVGVVEGTVTDRAVLTDGRRTEVEVLPALDGVRRLYDAKGRPFDLVDGALRVEEAPADGVLRSDEGVRFDWKLQGAARARGHWVQLLAPTGTTGDEYLDPRAAFCEDGVAEVWTQPRHQKEAVYKVRRVDRERYQLLLDRLPPEGSVLHLPLDVRNLRLQQRALRQLSEAPLPHHAGLLRLCEHPEKVRWPAARPERPATWHSLTDDTRSGTEEQRRFVAKALGTPDLAFLEGPPGSGKTTAICELVQQLVARGQRVLLCASTHVAIDNVLERLLASDAPPDAVRIGQLDRVDERVQACQLDRKVDDLTARWRGAPGFREYGDGELRGMAERTVIMAASLTCGTTMGIVNHPIFQDRDQDQRPGDRPVATAPHWDVLVVDEASKTLTQEFLVPALMARRHVIVGDVRHLPPFTDREDIVANLRALVDEGDREIFPRDHQRACLLLFRLGRSTLRKSGARWLVVEPASVLDRLGAELAEEGEAVPFSLVRVVSREGRARAPITEVSVEQVVTGDSASLHLAAADFVLVADDLLPRVSHLLPADLLPARDLLRGERALPESDPWPFRHGWWLSHERPLRQPYRERKTEVATHGEAERHEQR